MKEIQGVLKVKKKKHFLRITKKERKWAERLLKTKAREMVPVIMKTESHAVTGYIHKGVPELTSEFVDYWIQDAIDHDADGVFAELGERPDCIFILFEF